MTRFYIFLTPSSVIHQINAFTEAFDTDITWWYPRVPVKTAVLCRFFFSFWRILSEKRKDHMLGLLWRRLWAFVVLPLHNYRHPNCLTLAEDESLIINSAVDTAALWKVWCGGFWGVECGRSEMRRDDARVFINSQTSSSGSDSLWTSPAKRGKERSDYMRNTEIRKICNNKVCWSTSNRCWSNRLQNMSGNIAVQRKLVH